MMRITIEDGNNPPIVIGSDSSEELLITGFHFEPNPGGGVSMFTHDPIVISGSRAAVTIP